MRRLLVYPLVCMTVACLICPTQVSAANIFQHIGRGIKRTARFVVTLPDKITRPLGPILGPLAADILTQNIIRNPNIGRYFRGARNINRLAGNIDEQKRILRQMQEDFRKQSGDAAEEAAAVRKYKEEVAGQFTSGDITFQAYQDKVLALDRLAEGYDALSQKFSQAAGRMTPEQTVKSVSGNIFNRLVREIRDGVNFEIKSEMQRYFRPDVVKLLGGRNMDFNRIIDLLVEKEVSRDTDGMSDKEAADFRTRVRNRIKDTLRNNRKGLKQNWRQEIKNAIDKVRAEMEKNKKKLQNTKSSIIPSVKPTVRPISPAPGQGKCQPGYTFSPRSGIDCIQTNCNSVKSGHWDYTGHCVCGSSGSINENPQDPNKECYFGQDNAACPGCLYACVHLNENCPSAPKN